MGDSLRRCVRYPKTRAAPRPPASVRIRSKECIPTSIPGTGWWFVVGGSWWLVLFRCGRAISAHRVLPMSSEFGPETTRNNWPATRKDGRGDWIRTSDLSVPNRALYQAEPRPANHGLYHTRRLTSAPTKIRG